MSNPPCSHDTSKQHFVVLDVDTSRVRSYLTIVKCDTCGTETTESATQPPADISIPLPLEVGTEGLRGTFS
jgi:hypothetical protein